MSSPRSRHAWRRRLGRVVLGLLASLISALLALLWLTQTETGRALLLRVALQQVNGLLPGQIEIATLQQLDFSVVHLKQLSVRDPDQQLVAQIGDLRVEFDAHAILNGEYRVGLVSMAGAELDLRQMAQARRGLVAAFVDPDAPASPPSAAPAPYVEVRRIEISKLDVRAPEIAPLGQLDLRELALRGSFELDEIPRAELSGLQAVIERSGDRIGTLTNLSATLERGTAPSRIQLEAQLLSMAVTASAQLVSPLEATWQREPATVASSIDGVTSADLAKLLAAPHLESAFDGSVDLDATAMGSPDDLELDVAVHTVAGDLGLNARVEELERAQLQLHGTNLSPGAVRSGLPRQRFEFELAASVDGSDTEDVPLSLSLRNARIDATSLPTVDLSCRVTPQDACDLLLDIRDGPSRLRAAGQVGVDGGAALDVTAEARTETLRKWARFSGTDIDTTAQLNANLKLKLDTERRVDVHGSLTGRGLAVAGARARELELRVDLSGQPAEPTGEVRLRLLDAELGGQSIPRLLLSARGGPRRYALEIEGESGPDWGAAQLRVERLPVGVALQGKGNGKFRSQPWQFDLSPSRVRASELSSEGLTLTVAGQRLHLRGELSRRGGSVAFDAQNISLDALHPLLALAEPISGRADVTGRIQGSLEQPKVKLLVSGKRLSWGQRPAIDLSAEATLDSDRGELDADAELHSSETNNQQSPLAVRLRASHRFTGGAKWLASLATGRLDAQMDIDALQSRFVEAWAGVKWPFEAHVKGKLEAHGTRTDPKLLAQVQTAAQLGGVTLDSNLSFSLDDGTARASVTVDDEQGRWTEAEGVVELGAIDLRALPPATSIGSAPWQLQVDMKERAINTLPGLDLPQFDGVQLAAIAALKHERGAEPRGRVWLSARQTARLKAFENDTCGFVRTRVEIETQLEDGMLKADLKASSGRQRLLDAHAELPLSLREVLGGGQLVLGPLQANAKATQLELQTLPLLCGLVRGTLNGTASLVDPFGDEPQVVVALDGTGLSRGGEQTIDARLRAELNHNQASANLQLLHGSNRSVFRARVPIDLRRGRLTVAEDARLEASALLNRLPIAPFLPPKGSISHASGVLVGRAQARGTLAAPVLSGKLQLENVAFTATSLAQPLREVTGTLTLKDDKLTLSGFEAHDKDGVLQIDGAADLSNRKQLQLQLNINAKKFPLRQQGQVVATTNLRAAIRTELDAKQTRVTLDLGETDLWLETIDIRSGIALEPHPDFVVDGVATGEPQTHAAAQTPRSERPPGTQSPPARSAGAGDATVTGKPQSGGPPTGTPRRTTRMQVSAKPGVWVRREDFAVKLHADLDTRIAGSETRVEGQVVIERGYVELLGKVFDIDEGGYLRFIGSPTPDPVIQLAATFNNRRTGEVVRVRITGRSSAPVLTFSLDDQTVTAGQTFAAMYGSQRTNQDPGGAQRQASAFVGGLTAGLMATTVRRELGAAAPIIMVEPGQRAGQGRVRAGFEFDSFVPSFLRDAVTGVYVEGIADNDQQQAAGTQNEARVQAGVLLELYFPMSFFTTGQYGPGTTWSIDVGWQL